MTLLQFLLSEHRVSVRCMCQFIHLRTICWRTLAKKSSNISQCALCNFMPVRFHSASHSGSMFNEGKISTSGAVAGDAASVTTCAKSLIRCTVSYEAFETRCSPYVTDRDEDAAMLENTQCGMAHGVPSIVCDIPSKVITPFLWLLK